MLQERIQFLPYQAMARAVTVSFLKVGGGYSPILTVKARADVP
jgi:hypothetical protein